MAKFQFALFPLFLSGSLLFAQFGPGGPAGAHGGMGGGPGGPRGLHLGKVISGAPYSATVTDTNVRLLPDGNSIQHSTTGTVARDSQGRTYSQETITGMFGEAGPKTITFIADPVAGYVYTLNADTKTAFRRALHAPQESGTGSDERPPFKFGGPQHDSVNAVTADLGTQMMNGVNVQGKTVTRTIQAGQIGNEKPIVSTTETWYSPELQVVVASKRSDPSQGTTNYALTNISRAEPTAALFVVPSDYTVKDAPRPRRPE